MFFDLFNRFLLEKGIEVSIKDDDGDTALHIAIREAIKTHSKSELNESNTIIQFSLSVLNSLIKNMIQQNHFTE